MRALVAMLLLSSLTALSGCAGVGDSARTEDNSGGEASNLPAAEAVKHGDKSVADGNTDEALTHYVLALEKNPKDDATLCKVGLIHEARGNLQLAADAYKMAKDLAPKNVTALEGLGLIQFELRSYKEAEENLRLAVAADPKRWRSLNALGLIADQRQQFGQAIAYYRQALAVEPNSAMLHNDVGYSKYLSGDLAGAEQDFASALRLNPKYERAVLNMGLMHLRRGREDDAFTTFKSIMDEAAAYNTLGYLQMLDGKYPEAEEYFQRSISESPTYNAQANENLTKLRDIWRREAEGAGRIKTHAQ